MMKVGPVVVATFAVGCSSEPSCDHAGTVEAAYHLEARGIAVELATAPFGVRVLDGKGQVVVASATGEGFGEAEPRSKSYAPATWTTGNISTRAFPASGYFDFGAALDPWHELEVVGVQQFSSTDLAVHLHDKTATDSCITITYALRDSALRVEAAIDDHGAGTATPRAWSTGFASAAGEGFLGLGERFNKTNQRGVKVYSYAEEGGIGNGESMTASPDNPYPFGEAMAYYPVPFFVSTKGYGFWLDTTWRSQFEFATGGDERDDAWRVWHVGPRLAYEIFTPIPDDPRPWPYHVIDGFTAATGRPMVPPAWAYGPRRRMGPGDMQNGVTEDRAMRDLDLAITAIDDALHFYPNGSHVGRGPELSAWIARAESLGYRVNGYYNSMINRAAESPLKPQADEGLANDYFLLGPDGEIPTVQILTGGEFVDLWLVDFTSADASAWYGRSFDWATSLGYSGWMYDFGEYVQPEVVASNGMTGEELHNLYPVLYAKAAFDHMQAGAHANDWLAFMRSGYTGSSAFVPATWSGDPAASFEDADGLPSMIRGGVNAGISGIPNWGGDIGGFHCVKDGVEAADGELIARWIQQGALTPIMMDQDACVGADSSRKANIFSSADAQESWKVYARLHTRLLPYLYTLGSQANATGAPIMRHVFLEHPERVELASEDKAYYLGPGLFVAPVIERGARTKTVTLPPGTFLEWQPSGAGAMHAGGSTITLDAPLTKLPLLLRAGHLVPLLDPTIDTLAEEDSATIVSPPDVAEVYDVVGFLVRGDAARFAIHDGTLLEATWTGTFVAPALPAATTDEQLATCDACYRRTTLPGGIERVQISAPSGGVTAGGLAVSSTGPRRIRWDLYVAN